MAYIKLIQPRMIMRPMDTNLKTRMSPPLGLLTIASICREGNRISIENENVREINYDDNPDIVGITVTVDVLSKAVEIARRFKEKGIPVVAGGVHITTAFNTIDEDWFDVLCVGAAEGTWPDIMKDLADHNLKKVYRCRKPMTGDDIIGPAYDLIDSSEYLYCNVVHTSRGCPFKCDFCYNSGSEQRFVNRNIEDVLEEIKSLKKKHIMFIDDNFVGNPAWTKAFLPRLKEMNIKWNAAVSINVAFNEPLLDLMKECGCQSLFIGFESITEDSVRDVHKIQNQSVDYEKAIRNIHDRGIMIHASFAYGLDCDNVNTFKDTLDFIVRNRIETVTSHILTPYPGTKFYDRMADEGRIISDDLSLYNTANVVFKPKNMTPEELYEGYIRMYKEIYSVKNIIKRIPKKKDQRGAYLMFNIFYRKFGKVTDLICRVITYKRVGLLAERLSGCLSGIQNTKKSDKKVRKTIQWKKHQRMAQ